MRLLDMIADQDNVFAAWRSVRANRGSPGIDAVGVDAYEANLDTNLHDLERRLLNETYVPLPLRRASMPKHDGGIRDLAIPAVADRIAQRAAVNVLNPIFEHIFLECSFGYRSGRSVRDAVHAILAHRAAGYSWILDADIIDFFPSVDHELLMEQMRGRIGDRAILRLIALWIESGALSSDGRTSPSLLTQAAKQVMSAAADLLHPALGDADGLLKDELGSGSANGRILTRIAAQYGSEALRLAWDNRAKLIALAASQNLLIGGGVGLAVAGAAAAHRHFKYQETPRTTGAPQGGPISPLLSNIYLHAFDERMTGRGLRIVRYADDFVICCSSEQRAKLARIIAEEELTRLLLVINPQKTQIIRCDDGLRFLGYEFDADGAFPREKEGHQRNAEAARRIVTAGGARLEKGAATTRNAARNVYRDIHLRLRELRKGDS